LEIETTNKLINVSGKRQESGTKSPPKSKPRALVAILEDSNMNIDDYSFHDAILLSVTENSHEHYLDFLLDLPTNWDENTFEKRILRFKDVIFYNIDEIPFEGHPTILSIVNYGQITKSFGTGNNYFEVTRAKIEILTNAGNRIIEFSDCDLLIPTK
jgi:hypothetical protein